jgi:DNA polymerase I
MRYAVFDEAIEPRPHYPPKPVSFALKLPGRATKFYSWGHPTGNNCTFEEARAALGNVLARGLPLVMHNAKFDLAVIEEGMGLAVPPAMLLHDTMILAHLSNPYEPTFALKPLAEKHLSLPPAERDAVRDWLVEHGIVKAGAKDWGAHISKAPGDVVEPYCVGDVDRTAQLFDKLYADVEKRGMVGAYDRERSLIPLLMANEKHGIRVDRWQLEADVRDYHYAMEDAEAWLRKRLKSPDLNLDADAQLAEALARCGVVASFAKTRTGRDSVSKKNLTFDKFTDKRVFLALGYRNRLQTALSTFMRPWLETAQASGGRIYTSWRQLGAVTGRMSSSPNMQNNPKDWYDKPDGYEHPTFLKLPELPLLRKYILPDEGEVLIDADFGGQELRVAAHFENGPLAEAYRANPKLDAHGFVEAEIAKVTSHVFQRRVRKAGLFLTLYGGGPKRLAEELRLPIDEATALWRAFKGALPGIWEMDEELKELAKLGALPYARRTRVLL